MKMQLIIQCDACEKENTPDCPECERKGKTALACYELGRVMSSAVFKFVDTLETLQRSKPKAKKREKVK